MVRPTYPYTFVKLPPNNEAWPLGTIVDALWNDLWWKGEVTASKKQNGEPHVLVRFMPPPEGEGGPMLWMSMTMTRRALVWDTDHKAIQKYREECNGRTSGREPHIVHIGSWAEDTSL